MEKPSYKNIFL